MRGDRTYFQFYYLLPEIRPHLTGEIFKKGTQDYDPEFPSCFAARAFWCLILLQPSQFVL